jgi:dTDP-4-amino-4,6-dideoxygalactose transaminase
VSPNSRIQVAAPSLGEDELAAASAALASGQLTNGPRVTDLEARFAEYIGTRHAVAVSSGTAALHAALAALEVQPGDEVIVPPISFLSTVSAVIHQGGVPIFTDVDPETACMCPRDLETRIGSRTRAVIPVHLYGGAAEMDPISRIAERYRIAVVEDAAQAHGTLYRGQRVGGLGDLGTFSFFATKHMTTGEGGMVTTDDADLAERIRRFRSHGLINRTDHIDLGYNYRMTEMAAAIGTVQLERLETRNDRRIAVSEELLGRVADVAWLRTPAVPEHVRHTYFWCPITVDEQQLGMTVPELREHLLTQGVETRYRYREPLYRQPLLAQQVPPILRMVAGDRLPDYAALERPNADAVAGRAIGLPNRPDLSHDEIAAVDELLHEL